MIIENTSKTQLIAFYLRIEDKTEYMSIEPGKYIYVNESNWDLKTLTELSKLVGKDDDLRIRGDRKNYDIGNNTYINCRYV